MQETSSVFAGALILMLITYSSGNESPGNETKRFEVVCRVEHESFHRKGVWIFGMEDVPACMCTQLLFGSVDNLHTGALYWSYLGDICKENMKTFKCFKRRYPHLKTFVELGYWEGREHLRNMATYPAKRRIFTAQVIKFLLDLGLDGLSVFIGEEPFEVLSHSTKQNLAALLKELSAAFKPAGKLLSATFRGTENMQDFAKNIEPYVDFIYVMAFRMRQNDFGVTGMHTQLHPHESDPEKYKAHNIETYVRTLAKVVPKRKLLAVLAFEGTAFRLASSDKHGFYDPSEPGLSAVYKGQYTKNPRAIGYFEFCRLYDYDTWHHDWNETFLSTYVYSDKNWISYDDARSVNARARWLVSEGVGGFVAWSIEKDDFRGICGSVYPMLESIFNTVPWLKTSIEETSDKCVHGRPPRSAEKCIVQTPTPTTHRKRRRRKKSKKISSSRRKHLKKRRGHRTRTLKKVLRKKTGLYPTSASREHYPVIRVVHQEPSRSGEYLGENAIRFKPPEVVRHKHIAFHPRPVSSVNGPTIRVAPYSNQPYSRTRSYPKGLLPHVAAHKEKSGDLFQELSGSLSLTRVTDSDPKNLLVFIAYRLRKDAICPLTAVSTKISGAQNHYQRSSPEKDDDE